MGLKDCTLRINQRKRLIEYFVMEVTARSAANVMGIHPNSAALFYHKLREIIAVRIADDVPFDGEIEVDESYFGGVRKGKRGRGVAGKVPVFGLLKRGGEVHAVPVPDTSGDTLKVIMVNKINLIVLSILIVTAAIMSLISLGSNITGLTTCLTLLMAIAILIVLRISGTRQRGSYANIMVSPAKNFPLFLKECAFRFNYGSPTQQITLLLSWNLNFI